MVQQNIRETINKNNDIIEKSFTLGTFVLNEEAMLAQQQNAQLRQQCSHEFVDGFCVWCDVPEELV